MRPDARGWRAAPLRVGYPHADPAHAGVAAALTTMAAPEGGREVFSPRSGFPSRRHESLDERERLVGDFAPTVVDDERVAVAGYLGDLGHALVVLLVLVGGFGDRRWNRVVLLAGDDQERPAVGVFGVDFRLGPGVEVFGCRLEERRAGGRHREGLVEFLGLVFADGVGEGVAKLLVGQRNRAVAVRRIAKRRRCRLQR